MDEGRSWQRRERVPGWVRLLPAVALLTLSMAFLAALTAAQGGTVPTAPAGGASNWASLGGPHVPGGQVLALAVHPTISGTAYVAVAPLEAYDSGPSTIYKTSDGAATWTAAYTTAHQVYSLVASGSRVYAGAFNPGGEGSALYVSQDSGLSWTTAFSFTQRGVWIDLSGHPIDPDVAIAGGWGNTETGQGLGLVYGTDDGGLTWSPLLTITLPGDNANVTAVLLHPITPTILLAASRADNSDDAVIYRSADGGATWPVSRTIPGAHVVSLAANTSTSRLIYAGTGGSRFTHGPSWVYRSDDAGLTWSEVLGDAGGRLALEPPSTVYALAEWGELWASTADGDPGTWSSIGGMDEGAIALSLGLGPSPAALYAGGERRGVWKSSDGGGSWQQRNDSIQALSTVDDVAIDPQNQAKILAVGDCLGLWMTMDGGQTWSQPMPSEACPHCIEINPDDPQIVYMGDSGCNVGTIWRSDDGGLSYTVVYTPGFFVDDCSGGAQAIQTLAVAPSLTSTVYAGGGCQPNWQNQQAIVVRSLDDGATWSEVFSLPAESYVHVLAIDPSTDSVAYAGGHDCHTGPCQGFVYRTTDGGSNWTQVLDLDNTTVRSIVVDHGDPDLVYASADNYDVYRSTDGGNNWALILSNGPPFNASSGNRLALDPHLPGRLYLGGWGYIGESADGGNTWSDWGAPLNQGTPGMEPHALAMNYGTVTQTLYAGFSGLWSYTRLAPTQGNRYVATTGSDVDNPCIDPLAPCQTIDHALQQVNAGESVLLAAGTYTENLTIRQAVTLRGGYGSAVFRGSTVGETIIVGDSLGQPVVTIRDSASGTVLEDLTITGGNDEMGGGIYGSAADLTIRRCTIRNNWADGSPSNRGAGGVLGGLGGGVVTIEDSLILDNQVGEGASGVRVHQGTLALRNTIVANNLGDAAIHVNGPLSLMHTTVASNPDGGIIFNPPAGVLMTAVNSIIYGNGGSSIWTAEGTIEVSYSDVEGGWSGEMNIDVPPQFVDPAGRDYHLRRSSPVANWGTRYGAPALDFEGDARDFHPDMGADEIAPLARDVALHHILLPADPVFASSDPIQFGVLLFNAGYGGIPYTQAHCQVIRQSDGAVVFDGGAPTRNFYPGTMHLVPSPWAPWTLVFDSPDSYLFDCTQTTAGDQAPENDALSRTLTVLADAPDGWIRDHTGDDGDLPSGVDNWYGSPDIWVRSQDDGGLIHEDPVAGATNYVYVRIRNRGSQPLDGSVDLTWIEPALGTRCGDWAPIASLDYGNLQPGEVRILKAPWVPSRSGHTCLQAILDSPQDPYDRALECTPQWVPWDNNVGWRNVNIYANPGTRALQAAQGGEVQLVNVYNTPAEVDLIVERKTFPVAGTITLRLSEALFDRWQASAGAWQSGIEVLPASKEIQVTGAISATVGAIPMEAGEKGQVGLHFDAQAGLTFETAFRERIDGLTVGGVAYQWRIPDTTPPQLTGQSPIGGAVGVSPQAPIILEFSEAVGPLSLDLELTPNPGGWYYTWNEASTVVTATHAPFAYGAAHAASVTASDADGNPMVAPVDWSFSTHLRQLYLPILRRSGP